MKIEWNKPFKQTAVSRDATRVVGLTCISLGGTLLMLALASLTEAIANRAGLIWMVVLGLILVALGVAIDRDRMFGKRHDGEVAATDRQDPEA